MKKRINVILPLVVVILAVAVFVGWRTWDAKERSAGKWPALDGGVYAQAVSDNGVEYLVPPDQVYASGLKPDDRPALTAPNMVDIATADNKLADDLEGIAVSVGGEQRFYPFQILNWHEVVNDTINGQSFVITYSPLTGSAVVYKDNRHFSDAGQIYNNAMLMKTDTDDTLWNQTSGQAIVGTSVGQTLEIYPSIVMTWATWKDLHPNGLALSTDTGYNRDYGRHPYASYETSPGIFFPLNHTFDGLQPKDVVYRLDYKGQTLTYVKNFISSQADLNDSVGTDDDQLLVAAFKDADTGLVRFYNRQVNDRTLTFYIKNNAMYDHETNSRWSAMGVATGGSLRGTALTEVPATHHYAFANFAMFPNTKISGADLLPPAAAAPSGDTLEIN